MSCQLTPFDEPPLLSLANIRPYCVALLLHKGYLIRHDAVATLTGHCNIDDLRVGGVDPFDNIEYDGSRLEKLVDEYIGESVHNGTLEWDPLRNVWALTPGSARRVAQWAITLNGAIPLDLRTKNWP
jgi:hypothetical protein